eukprot:6136073-Pyramimonas_sp.AAC.1
MPVVVRGILAIDLHALVEEVPPEGPGLVVAHGGPHRRRRRHAIVAPIAHWKVEVAGSNAELLQRAPARLPHCPTPGCRHPRLVLRAELAVVHVDEGDSDAALVGLGGQ